MPFLTTLLYILIMLVILGVLISIHEAGHLAAAKMFKVYCFEYSIGFGPKLLKVRRKGGETYFSLRAIPLGGYVSMYNDTEAVPEGMEAPAPERALSHINKAKKCTILLAGVVMNFLLGLVLIFISDIAFSKYYIAYGGSVQVNETTQVEVDCVPLLYSEDVLDYVNANKSDSLEATDYFLSLPAAEADGSFYRIVDTNAKIYNASGVAYGGGISYVAIYYPQTLTKERDIMDTIVFYPAKADAVIEEKYQTLGITALPDLGSDSFSFKEEGAYVDFHLRVFPAAKAPQEGTYSEQFLNESITCPVRGTMKDGALLSNGAGVRVIEERNDWGAAWRQWAEDVPNACGAIVQGFASLFTPGGFQNLSGIVGMTSALPQIEALGGPGYIFYFAGLISINLAFFNLLPFPGLDGWQLVVTVVEAITRKKMPEKAQSIASVIGFVLLGLLMVAVTIKDIIGLF